MLQAAIVGLGKWGQNLVRSVQGQSNEITFVAGVVRDPAKTQPFADQYGFPLHHDMAPVLSNASIDAVVLATPHTTHADLIRRAAQAGKHVYTEKPFALSLEAAVDSVRVCAENGVTLAVGYNWRFQPALRHIRQMLNDGTLGKLLHIEGNFCGPSVY